MDESEISKLSVVERNNVRILGRGTQPMVFAHGFGCDQNMWRLVVPAFEDSYRIVLFDQVGAGASDLSAYDRLKYDTLGGYAADVLELCDALSLSEVVFVGHSVSSMIGVLAAKKRPELFRALVLVGPSPRYVDDGVVQLLDRSDLNGDQRRVVRLLKSSSENMLNLLNHVLELSKAESSGFALVETPFSPGELVEDVVATFEPKAREKQIRLRASLDDRVPGSVLGDLIAIRQIVSNLVGNAVRFTQASYDTVMKFGGSGLGLTITRKLLALYGSKVDIASVPGQGSTFSFRLRLPVAGQTHSPA